MSNSRVVADALVVVPESDDLVLSSRDEVLALLHDGKSIQLSGLRAVQHADGLAIEAVPVGDLAIRSGGEELRLIRVEHHLLEHGGLKQALDSHVGHDVPDDAGSVVRS